MDSLPPRSTTENSARLQTKLEKVMEKPKNRRTQKGFQRRWLQYKLKMKEATLKNKQTRKNLRDKGLSQKEIKEKLRKFRRERRFDNPNYSFHGLKDRKVCLDYILLQNRCQGTLLNVSSKCPLSVTSDHKMVISHVKLKIPKRERKSFAKRKLWAAIRDDKTTP
jgi:hypothetical protein